MHDDLFICKIVVLRCTLTSIFIIVLAFNILLFPIHTLLQFLDRCTPQLNLPFAARRLYDENGKELQSLEALERDQLVYVSSGEPWVNPKLSTQQQQRRLLLASLTSDIDAMKMFCALRNPGSKSWTYTQLWYTFSDLLWHRCGEGGMRGTWAVESRGSTLNSPLSSSRDSYSWPHWPATSMPWRCIVL